jgi:small subunit ribosomal protein S18
MGSQPTTPRPSGPGGDRPSFGGRSGGPRPGGHRPSGPGGRRGFSRRRKVCKFCVEKIDYIDYKDSRMLGQFVPERGKILPMRTSGVCAPHQRRLMRAIKQARNIAMLPFATES